MSSAGLLRSRSVSVYDSAIPAGCRIALYAIAATAMVSPLLWVRVPPLVDYPNHLARMWILVHRGEIPALAANYIVDWRILPDLGMDLVVCGLSRFLPVELAGRVFVGLTMLALFAGTLVLHRVLHGRWGLWPLCSVLFIYNAALFWGFVSCLFGVGAYFFAFSGWIASSRWPTGLRVGIFSVVASLLLLLHLFAFGLYAVSLAAYEIGRCVEVRRISLVRLLGWSAMLLQLVPGLALWRLSLVHGGSTLTLYGGPREKLHALLAPFMFDWLPANFDRALAAAVGMALILALATGSLKLAPSMRLPLAALIAAALLMPNRMSGGWNADIRLPVTLPFLILSSTQLDVVRKGAARALAVGAVILFGLRIWSVSESWRDYDHWFGEFRRASAVIAPGARLLPVENWISGDQRRMPGLPMFFATLQPMVFLHIGALAVIDRAAFFPYMFTGWTTIRVTPANKPVSEREAGPVTLAEIQQSTDPKLINAVRDLDGQLPYWRDWPNTFDYALWIDFKKPGRPRPRSKHLRLLASGDFFRIFRVVRP